MQVLAPGDDELDEDGEIAVDQEDAQAVWESGLDGNLETICTL